MPTSAREEPRIRRSVPRFGKLFCRADVGIGPYNFSRVCGVIVNSEKTYLNVCSLFTITYCFFIRTTFSKEREEHIVCQTKKPAVWTRNTSSR